VKKSDTVAFKPNRKTPPPIRQVSNIILPTPIFHQLDNGIPIHETRLGTQEIMKLDIVWRTGRPDEHKRLATRATTRLLREGTPSFNSAQIADILDFYAGTFQSPTGMDFSSVTVYCMTKHFQPIIPLVAEIILQPTFPQKELDVFKDTNIQRLNVELTKNDTIAYREITERIFGAKHPYGENSFPQTYLDITRDDLVKQHAQKMTSDNCTIFLSGKTDDNILKLINQYLGQTKTTKILDPYPLRFETPNQTPQKIRIPNPANADAKQSSIRIGRRLFNRHHPDYPGFYILNTIFGGYFSSRLMTNIREEKGYSYNIYSATDTMSLDGYFYIASEVGNEVVQPTLKEIYAEMEILRTQPVPQQELEMVRNYLLGNLLTILDGPFNIADFLKSLTMDNIPFEALDQLIHTIKTITPEELLALAQKYFNPADFWEIIAGA